MPVNNERIKEIYFEIHNGIKNAEAREDEKLIRNSIVDSIYWINVYQLINALEDELTALNCFLNKDSDKHFIDDVTTVRYQLKMLCARRGISTLEPEEGNGLAKLDSASDTGTLGTGTIINSNNPGIVWGSYGHGPAYPIPTNTTPGVTQVTQGQVTTGNNPNQPNTVDI